MKRLTEKRAAELKAQGYTQIASVVKTYYNTTYWNVNEIDVIMENGGKWIPAPYNTYGWHGRAGTPTNKIDWSCTCGTKEI